MPKDEPAKEIASQLFSTHSLKQIKDIVRELQTLINLTTVKVYYSGVLDDKSKEIINGWISDKVHGDYTVEYVQDKTLIAGFKIVYRDYIYDSSVLNSFKNEIWK
ncbi:F0F1 ATP synthase subunit delta [candidate division WWE3 bacterium]|uniref:F0F1 ATP synthase subunit delta n=1 Tax=candidate division WWE3 bacterium TaxID=2053526 RepID=A0A7X9HHS1_UNCKA|nr:F0F1 ATP synthase subunit delta [candidate division WWE3 bacterium]